MVIATLGQGGLSLPDRDYYFKTDSASQHVRAGVPRRTWRARSQLLGDRPPTPARAGADRHADRDRAGAGPR